MRLYSSTVSRSVASLTLLLACTLPTEAAAKPTLAGMRAGLRGLLRRSGGLEDGLRSRVHAAELLVAAFTVGASNVALAYTFPRRDELLALAPRIRDLTLRINGVPEARHARLDALRAEEERELRRLPGYATYAAESEALATARRYFTYYNDLIEGDETPSVKALSRRAMHRRTIERLEPREASWQPFEEVKARFKPRYAAAEAAVETEKADLLRQRDELRGQALALVNGAARAAGLPLMPWYTKWYDGSLQFHQHFNDSYETKRVALTRALEQARHELPLAASRFFGFQSGARARHDNAVLRLTAAVTTVEELAAGVDPAALALQNAAWKTKHLEIARTWFAFYAGTGERY